MSAQAASAPGQSRTQADIIAGLPRHLRPYVKEQDYARYTAQDHAVWRFVMRQLMRVLATAAHPVYLEGLARTGISLEHIPSVDEMNACLGQLGWSALVVDGYIPTAIFSEFQSRRILVIAMDMRSIDQVLYTPAPDIVHESAGHAPFIADVDYAEYLQRFGEVSLKAIATEADEQVYRAVRRLSELKQARDSAAGDLEAAEREVAQAFARNDDSSEAALLSRLQWWTIEYGLVGAVHDYKLFGAGLLSSLGESISCQDDARVRKLPLTLEAIKTGFDITRPQPQLFVAKSCQHLTQLLETFADGMCFRRGGAESLRVAIGAGTVCTAQYSSGLEVSGVFDRLQTDAVGNAIYLGTRGPTQLACRGRVLDGHGSERHTQGFGSPVGRLQGLPRCLSEYAVDELKALGIAVGSRVRLEFLSGITVEGQLQRLLREQGRNLLLTLGDCRVTGLDGACLFDPAWGDYDLAVGERIRSVWGGAADRENFAQPEERVAESTPPAPASEHEQRLYALYARVRALRERGAADAAELASIADALQAFPDDWLLRLELAELGDAALRAGLRADLTAIGLRDAARRRLVDLGLSALDDCNPRPDPR